MICRVTGVDADETPKDFKGTSGQKYGQYGKDTLQKLIEKGEISVQVSLDPKDNSYGRNICLIKVKGKNLSTSLVEAGAAYVYANYVKPEMLPELQAAEERAKKARAGIWQEPDKERPWDYRARTRTP